MIIHLCLLVFFSWVPDTTCAYILITVGSYALLNQYKSALVVFFGFSSISHGVLCSLMRLKILGWIYKHIQGFSQLDFKMSANGFMWTWIFLIIGVCCNKVFVINHQCLICDLKQRFEANILVWYNFIMNIGVFNSFVCKGRHLRYSSVRPYMYIMVSHAIDNSLLI